MHMHMHKYKYEYIRRACDARKSYAARLAARFRYHQAHHFGNASNSERNLSMVRTMAAAASLETGTSGGRTS